MKRTQATPPKSLRNRCAIALQVSLAALLLSTNPAAAAPTYVSGHITNVTFAGESVMIMLDAGLPDNCIGSAYGWMKIPLEYKSMSAFVIGLWMRGDATQTLVTVYTDGLVSGYCRITQIDPEN